YVRRFAVKALGNLGEEAKGSIGALKTIIDTDEHEDVIVVAIDALGKMGPSAVPLLCKIAEDEKQKKERRQEVIAMIANMKVADVAAQAVPMLKKLLKDKDADIKTEAIQDLARYGAEAKD